MREMFKQEDLFSLFFKNLENRKNATTIEESLGNIAYCFSKSLNYNLLPLFQNVLKFTIDESTANSIKQLPLAPDKLIYDQNQLWFTTPFDTIPLNIRSINYLNQKNYYQLYVDDILVSETADGNNLLFYSLLKNMDSKTLTVKLLDSDRKLIDSQRINLRKRTNLNMAEYYKDFTFFDTQGYSKPEFKDGIFSIINVEKKLVNPGLEMPFPLRRNRDILVTAKIKNEPVNPDVSNNINCYTFIAIGGGGGSYGTTRVGYDIAKDDKLNYYNVDFSFNTNGFFNADWSVNLKFITQKFYLFPVGITNGFFKDIIYKDITDTDHDGIIDFEDPCPEVYGTFGGCPQNQTSASNIKTDELNIYPNPTADKLNVKTNEIDGEISIYDIFGKCVVHQKIYNNNMEIDVSQFKQGTYMVKVITNNLTHTTKFVKM
jgi:hypothetical protein